jgi:hypothetical protein
MSWSDVSIARVPCCTWWEITSRHLRRPLRPQFLKAIRFHTSRYPSIVSIHDKNEDSGHNPIRPEFYSGQFHYNPKSSKRRWRSVND